MPRRILLSILLIAFLLRGHAQTDHGFISIATGASFPIGPFGSKDLNKDGAGFAKTGPLINVSYSRTFLRGIGLCVSLQGQVNPIDTRALENTFSQTNFYQGVVAGSVIFPPTTLPTVTYSNWHFNKDAWNIGTLLIGACSQLPLNKPQTLSLTSRILIGPTSIDPLTG